MQKEKNCFIELYRFIASILIMLHHLYFLGLETPYVFWGGYIWTDFFFILSGAFTMQYLDIHKNELLNSEYRRKIPIAYTVKKISKIFPYTTLGIFLSIIVLIYTYSLSFKETVKLCLYLPIQLFRLEMFGIMPRDKYIKEGFVAPVMFNIPLWYISAMIAALPIVILIVIYIDKFFKGKLYLALLCYGGMMLQRESIMWIESPIGSSVHIGVVRAMAGLLLGSAVYEGASWLRSQNISKRGKMFFTVVEIVMYGLAIGVTAFFYNQCDTSGLFFMFVSLIITLSNQSYTAEVKGKICLYLGRLSVPIYTVHMPIFFFMNHYIGYEFSMKKAIGCFLLTFIVAFFVKEIVSFMEDKDKIFKEKIIVFFKADA